MTSVKNTLGAIHLHSVECVVNIISQRRIMDRQKLLQSLGYRQTDIGQLATNPNMRTGGTCKLACKFRDTVTPNGVHICLFIFWLFRSGLGFGWLPSPEKGTIPVGTSRACLPIGGTSACSTPSGVLIITIIFIFKGNYVSVCAGLSAEPRVVSISGYHNAGQGAWPRVFTHSISINSILKTWPFRMAQRQLIARFPKDTSSCFS